MSTVVAVLAGGWSVEREVSLVTGEAVHQALLSRGTDARLVDVGRDIGQVLAELKPDVVFNALHGRFGEDGTIQGLLEILGLPYTHSGVTASALAMDKPVSRELFTAAGLPVPDGVVVARDELIRHPPYDPPYVIKPLNEGSSVGVRIVLAGDNTPPGANGEWRFGPRVLVERYIPGREIQVAVRGDEALGAIEILTDNRFYDYEAKYAAGMSRHVMPAEIPDADYREALRLGLAAHRTLGCRGVTRSDLRYDDTGAGAARFYLLETNTQPGLTPTSLVPEIAAARGIDFAELCQWMVEDAGCDR